jgi:hypothetical protein
MVCTNFILYLFIIYVCNEINNFFSLDIQDESDALSYKEVSEMSEITQESFPEGYMISHGGQAAAIEDLVDFEKLKQ